MKLRIDDYKTIDELQEKFTECFPGFRIDFFKNQNALKTNSPADGFLTIADISKKHKPGEMEIKSTYTAAKIIQDFKRQYGLLVRLYQLEGNEPVPLLNEKTLAFKSESLNTKNSAIMNPTSDGADEEVRLSL